MTQAIEKAPSGAWNVKGQSNLAQVTGFNDRIIQLIKATVCPGANAVELASFLYNAKRLGLDPMTRQIYFIKYAQNRPGEIVVGINGYRSQADATGMYAGSDEAEFEYEDVGQPKGAPSKATVTVWKLVGGQRMPFTASARWKEFYPGDGKEGEQYRKRPHNQLSIRAESHALRKAFPQVMERFEMQVPPGTWERAAAADDQARNDPDKIARDSQRYVEIFGEREDGPAPQRIVDYDTGEVLSEPSSTQDPTAPEFQQSSAVDPQPSPPSDSPLADKYRRNRELIKRARELGIEGFEPLGLGKAQDVVEAANLELEDRIARFEWEQAEVARQKANEGLLH
jgi:phage recombination protein Bet